MEAFATSQSMPFLQLLLLLLLFLCIDVCLSQPISFNATIPFNKTAENYSLYYEGGYDSEIFIWLLHPNPAIFNLSFPTNVSDLGVYHSVSAAYLGYVANTTTKPAYILSVLLMGVEAAGLTDPRDGRIIWRANRDNPIRGVDPTLTIDQDGHLVLLGGGKEPVWQTNATGSRLELRGDGNLLLYDGVGQSEAPSWQSFDHPDDTLTMGQVIRGGTRLISRSSDSDLSSGAFSLLLDEHFNMSYSYSQDGNPNSVCYLQDWLYSRSSCAKGLIGCAIFYFSDAMAIYFYCDKYCNNNRAPMSFAINSSSQYHLASFSSDIIPDGTVLILRLMPDGNVALYQFHPHSGWNDPQLRLPTSALCFLPARCDPYSTCFPENKTCSTTCTTESGKSCMLTDGMLPPTCQNPPNDKWEMGTIPGRYYTFGLYDVPLNVTGLDQCRDMCFQNCSCTASFFYPDVGCYLITNKLLHLTEVPNSSYLVFIKMPSSMPFSKAKNHVLIIVLTLVSAFIISSIIIAVMIIVKKRRKACENAGCSLNEEEDDFLKDALHTITKFSYEEIEAMTNGFCTKLGGGGFGSVYEGLLASEQKVAVKRLDSVSGQGSKEFRAEVAIMAGIHHRNLVDLLGFCADNLHRLLVYEHMPFGSLDRWLFNTNDKNEALLTWQQRFKIAVGVANGLAYLHEGCAKKIIHLDVKPQNILLDHNFNAKVGDFGLSRLLSQEESFAVTTMRGTPGYLAPEWLREGGVTEKMDVYSFGMVLLELVSGRKNYNMQLIESEKRYYPVWAFDKLKEGKEMELLDPNLAHQLLQNEDIDQDHEQGHDDDDDVMQFKRTIHIAFLCVQEEPQCRPRMSDVVKMLEGGETLPPLPLNHDIRGFLRSRTITSPTNSASTLTSSTSGR